MKIPKRLSSFLTLLIFMVFVVGLLAFQEKKIRAFLNAPRTNIVVDDFNSELIGLLILPETTPKQFFWYSLTLTQSFADISLGRSDIRESGTSILGGFYRGYEIDVTNQITHYLNDETAYEAFSKKLSDIPTGDFSRLIDVSNLQQEECLYYVDNFARCRIRFVLSDKVFYIEMRMYNVTDFLIAEEALNQWLIALAKALD